MSIIVGVDEVGRGCWAGPLVVGAVILRTPISGLNDSKLLTKARRENLAAQIHDKAEVGLGWIGPAYIDKVGLTHAIRTAMLNALRAISGPYDEIIIDGKLNFLADNPKAITIIKADQTIPAVSAASIAAKVARDAYMQRIAELHPKYGFEKHFGYGTKLHLEMLKLHGACELHRMSYKPLQGITISNV